MMVSARPYPRVVIIGVGNLERRDDGAGILVARAVRQRARAAGLPGVEIVEHSGEVASLLEAWSAAEAAMVVDAVRSGASAGTVHRLDARSTPLPFSFLRCSSHGLGVSEAIELGRALGRLPERSLVVYGVEGLDFGHGQGVTPEVAAGVVAAASRIMDEIDALREELVNA